MSQPELQSPQLSVRILGIVLVVLITAGFTEGVCRFLILYRTHVKLPMAVQEYQIRDSRQPFLWRLKPGYGCTLAEAIRAKRQSGRQMGAAYLEDRAAKLGVKPEDVLFRIDSDGYKGPELDKSHSRLRILTLGDSCTFGTFSDSYSYPRSLERALNQQGLKVEVVNGGVEGYSPQQVLMRMEEFKGLHPEITTIYIGWNAFFSPESVPRFARSYTPYTWRALKYVYGLLAPEKAARQLYYRPKHADRHDPLISRLSNYVPPFFPLIERIVTEMQSSGNHVVILTLPGLYRLDEAPSPLALKVGQLPEFTGNPYVLAKLSDSYNKSLRALAAQQGVGLIDLDRWSSAVLEPRDVYFADSVHLYEEGQQKLGEYLALQLAPLVTQIRDSVGHQEGRPVPRPHLPTRGEKRSQFVNTGQNDAGYSH